MSNPYRDMSDSVLLMRWEELRGRILAARAAGSSGCDITQGDWHDAFAMRREIDRRRGNGNPSADVNFEEYVKD